MIQVRKVCDVSHDSRVGRGRPEGGGGVGDGGGGGRYLQHNQFVGRV